MGRRPRRRRSKPVEIDELFHLDTDLCVSVRFQTIRTGGKSRGNL